MVAKAVIVLVAFPVLVHAIYSIGTLVLGLMLPQLLAMAGSWAEVARKGMIGGTFLVAVRASFGVCRRMWPVPAVK
jgi:hypothetical protein